MLFGSARLASSFMCWSCKANRLRLLLLFTIDAQIIANTIDYKYGKKYPETLFYLESPLYFFFWLTSFMVREILVNQQKELQWRL